MSSNQPTNNPGNTPAPAQPSTTVALDNRRREELEFFRQPRTHSEFLEFLVQHNQSKAQAFWRLTHGLVPLNLVDKKADGKYEINAVGAEALKEGKFEVPAGYKVSTAQIRASAGIKVKKKPVIKAVALSEKEEFPEPKPVRPLLTKPKPEEPVFIKILSGNGVEVPPINLGNYYWHKQPDAYVQQNSEMIEIEAHLDDGLPLLFTGPKGTGKTQSVITFAYQNNIPLVILDCNENTDEGDLRGKFIIKGTETPFIVGKMPTAIAIANHVGKCIFLMEEINALTPQTQKIGNALLDARQNCDVPALAKTFHLDNDVKLLCIGTMNYGYGGTFELNEDFKSRFIEIFVNYPDKKHEEKILKANTQLREELIDPLISVAVETRNAVEQGVVDYALSPRDLVLFGKALHSYENHFKDGTKALLYALKNAIVNRYSDKKNRDWIAERIQSIFPGGVKIKV